MRLRVNGAQILYMYMQGKAIRYSPKADLSCLRRDTCTRINSIPHFLSFSLPASLPPSFPSIPPFLLSFLFPFLLRSLPCFLPTY